MKVHFILTERMEKKHFEVTDLGINNQYYNTHVARVLGQSILNAPKEYQNENSKIKYFDISKHY